MPLSEQHPVRLPQGFLLVDGKPQITPGALIFILNAMSDKEVFELHNYADVDPEQYCERATEWLLQRGKVSV